MSNLDHHLAEVSAREMREWDAKVGALRAMWHDEVINPAIGSLVDRAYRDGILPLPPLDINGDGIWTRNKPWYIATGG